MGAGTNAQTRLVALHHLDAPWRPADIAQREGRILRQGNTNATVKILRYVTEGSFDAYMWQTLETKAKFIGQVMTGQTVARRIEDFDSPALTFAEVKAIASGNPLVLEKAKVDAEVMRLARLRAEFNESQFDVRARLRMAEEDVARLQRQTAALEQDVALRQDTQGDRFRMTLEKKVYADRAAAGAALVYLVNDHREDHLRGLSGTLDLGELAGFRLEYRSTLPDKVILRGRAEYVASVSPSPLGSISSLEHAVRSIEEHVIKCRQEQQRCEQQASELVRLNGSIFEHEERYRDVLKRQSELVDLLDLAKNQAAAQHATESTESTGGPVAANSPEGSAPAPEVAGNDISEVSPRSDGAEVVGKKGKKRTEPRRSARSTDGLGSAPPRMKIAM
jgi:hypothetical protein